MDNLLKAISQYVAPTDILKNELQQRLKPMSFKKREVLLNAESTCVYSYFIKKGILRLYYSKDGKEVTEFFCSEGEWMNSPKSFMGQIKDIYKIDAVEETEVLALHVMDLIYLFENCPEMEKYARLDMGSTFIHLMDRLATIRFATAREKYEHFLTSYPDIHHRIPLGMVASYVGVAQETLSRLRGNR